MYTLPGLVLPPCRPYSSLWPFWDIMGTLHALDEHFQWLSRSPSLNYSLSLYLSSLLVQSLTRPARFPGEPALWWKSVSFPLGILSSPLPGVCPCFPTSLRSHPAHTSLFCLVSILTTACGSHEGSQAAMFCEPNYTPNV